jgi:hypothetical protein
LKAVVLISSFVILTNTSNLNITRLLETFTVEISAKTPSIKNVHERDEKKKSTAEFKVGDKL